jgi:hypothetical protein
MSAVLTLAAVLAAPPLPVAPRPRPGALADEARAVVAAVVEAARENRRRPRFFDPGARPPYRLSGDALANYYARRAAAAARKLPAGRRARAYLLGLGVALDTSALLRKNPVTGLLWARVETRDARSARLEVLGRPTLHGRHDLLQHFVVSAALTAVLGARAAEAAGVFKELLDSEEGGSGFSFADLAADLGGIGFAQQVLGQPGRLAELEKSFAAARYALPPKGLMEGLSRAQFERRYGSPTDKRFRTALEDLRKRTLSLPGYSSGSASSGA